MSHLKGIIFDFDGVLVESVEVKARAFARLFADHPGHVDEIVRYHQANMGVSRFDKLRHIYRHILKQPLSDHRFDELCRLYARYAVDGVIAAPLVPGAREFLQGYWRQLPLHVVSTVPQGELRNVLEARGLVPYFQGIYGSPTPKSAWIREILESTKVQPTEMLLVGDALSDLETAQGAGVPFVGRVGDGLENPFNGRPVAGIVRDMWELVPLVTGAHGRGEA